MYSDTRASTDCIATAYHDCMQKLKIKNVQYDKYLQFATQLHPDGPGSNYVEIADNVSDSDTYNEW